MSGFRWTKTSEQAARDCAEDVLTNDEIAERAKISRSGLDKWKVHPEFAARVKEIVMAFREAILTQGIADKVNRVGALDSRWRLLKQVVAERGASEEMQEVPGGKTGMLVKSYKRMGSGADAYTVEEYAVDTGLLAEMRNTEKQAAQEVGQWSEKAEVTHNGDQVIKILKGVSMDDI